MTLAEPSAKQTDEEALALRHMPILMLDRAEPYPPVAAGYTVFRGPGGSPSSRFEIVPRAALTVEYALWYDWDIGHLYDLEHVWVHLDGGGEVVAVEASRHGRREPMDAGTGPPECAGGRPVLYVEAGKHAHWAHPDQMDQDTRWKLPLLCGPAAGYEGVHLGNPFAQAGAYSPTARDHRLARLKMRADAFRPVFAFGRAARDPRLLPWPSLAAWIPDRVRQLMAALPGTVPHIRAVLLDCGDTLVDERTEVKRPGTEVVLSGDLIPHARETIEALEARGHRLILLADGPRESFVNLLGQHGLWDRFAAHVISEDVGASKPSSRMFEAALAAAGLGRADAREVVMVGNNLSRDIKGAKALGIASIFLAWSTLRSHLPADPSEQPDYTITSLNQLPTLLDTLEPALRFRTP